MRGLSLVADIQTVYVDCEGPEKADDMRKQWPSIFLTSFDRFAFTWSVTWGGCQIPRTLRSGNNNLVTVMIPEFVNGGWWTQLLHRRMAAKLKISIALPSGFVP